MSDATTDPTGELSTEQVAAGDGAEPTTFSEAFHADAARLIRRYPVARSALLPLLHLVQSEHGYVTRAGIAFCAAALDLTKAEVGAVATFYTMFKREPVGNYLLSVCTNPTCQVAGSQVIFDRYKEALGGGLRDPETGVTIEQAECLGICDAAPVVQVNYEMYGPLTDDEADSLFAACRSGAGNAPVSSWSGEPAPTFIEVERELSGADDAFADQLVEAARHSITGYDVPPSYKTGETDIPVTHPGGDRAGHGGEIFAAAFAPGSPATNGSGPAQAHAEQPGPDADAEGDAAAETDDGPDADAEGDDATRHDAAGEPSSDQAATEPSDDATDAEGEG